MMDGALPAEPDYKALINRAPLMIFMKGNRDEPRCGFSRTLMEILKGKKNESLQLKPRQIY